MARGSAGIAVVAVIAFAVTACATTGSAPTEKDGVYTVWAQYGSMSGSWEHARSDAIAQAQRVCADKGLTYVFLSEQRSGTYGWSPQRSTISFRCEKGFAQTVSTINAECHEQLTPFGDRFALHLRRVRSVSGYRERWWGVGSRAEQRSARLSSSHDPKASQPEGK
jgi:membrane-bound inhibitor of C-type lysozyme